jgi:redox-sensitive bicupin YhaK (pirin superfamily)
MPLLQALAAHDKDLGGGFVVRRLLPAARRRAVGPFVFFDHFGPTLETPEAQHDVRPHPHIGLATVTYLFEGAMLHRDSLGSVQRIEPGAINWMTAGRGIVHSERKPDDLRQARYTIHGLQLWAALPSEQEEAEPSFAHTPAAALPVHRFAGGEVRVLIGEAFGLRSPVAAPMATRYLDIRLAPGAALPLPGGEGIECAVYAVDRALAVDGEPVAPHQLAVLDATQPATVGAPDGARFVLIGGAPLDGPRFMWWNFVSSRKERIEQAKADWAAQRMGTIPGETEWIELPA